MTVVDVFAGETSRAAERKRGEDSMNHRWHWMPQTDQEGTRVPCERETCDEMLLVWRKTPKECQKGGGHQVYPKTWPPKARPGSNEEPSIAARCTECGQTVILYERPEGLEGVVIHKPAEKKVAVPR